MVRGIAWAIGRSYRTVPQWSRWVARCSILLIYFVLLDYICLNVGLWGVLVVGVSAAILVAAHSRSGAKKAAML